jgi:2-iminobutanoate/2-iminopropanoate deaminase
MPKQIVTSAWAPTSGKTPGQAVSPLAQAIRFGNMVFVSGLGSVDSETGEVMHGDIALQTRQALDNLTHVLNAAGATRENIVNLRITLRDIDDFSNFYQAFRAHFKDEKVTWTCIGGIPNRPDVNVQVDCIAMFD